MFFNQHILLVKWRKSIYTQRWGGGERGEAGGRRRRKERKWLVKPVWMWKHFGESSASLSGPTYPSWVEKTSQLSLSLWNIQFSSTPAPTPAVFWGAAAYPRITELLTHICSGDFSFIFKGFLGYWAPSQTQQSSIQCQVIGCGVWGKCDRNSPQFSEGDRCAHK